MGQTENFERRFDEHNRGKTKFMASGTLWVKVFSVDFESRIEAMNLEKNIKKRGAFRFLSDYKNADE